MNPDALDCDFEKTQSQKKKELLVQQLAMLDMFLDRNAITKENYDKGVSALKKELELIDYDKNIYFFKNVKPDRSIVRLNGEIRLKDSNKMKKTD